MEPLGEHPVTAGPLSVRWLAVDVAPPRAGAIGRVRVTVENAGLATWTPQPGDRGVKASYHWLDPLGNALLWDGARTELPHAVPPGGRVEIDLAVRAAMPPGRYRLALDLVDELKRWFGEVGSFVPQVEVEVAPRIERRLAVLGADPGALAAQDEPEAVVVDVAEAAAVAHLAPGVEPAPDWVRRVLDAHQEGYGVVGGSVAAPAGLLRRQARALHAWAPGGGRNPLFAGPLLCASVAAGVEAMEVEPVSGLPAHRAPAGEPWVYDGRITARLRSGRRPS
jgi:hypothetical protein